MIAQGGSFGGWSLYFRHGVPRYAHNFVGMETAVVAADSELSPGDHVLQLRFDYDGGGAGRGGEVRFIADGVEIGKGRVEKTVPALFSFDEGLDVGFDSLDPVVDDYATPKGAFTGTIDKVVIDIDPRRTTIRTWWYGRSTGSSSSAKPTETVAGDSCEQHSRSRRGVCSEQTPPALVHRAFRRAALPSAMRTRPR